MAAPKNSQSLRQELLKRIKSSPHGLDHILADETLMNQLRADAEDQTQLPLIPKEILDDYAEFATRARDNPLRMQAAGGKPVVVVPGFLGSSLRDVAGGNDLIWIDPTLVTNGGQLNALKLSQWDPQKADVDVVSGVKVVPSGVVPVAYDLLKWRLSWGGYDVRFCPFDWRKNIEESANKLVLELRNLGATTSSGQRIRVIAHSQGSLVARRAIQLLGKSDADRLIERLILLGPATYGTFTAAMAISGNDSQIEFFQRWAIHAPGNVASIFQSMSGLYQLLPWNQERMSLGINPDTAFQVALQSVSSFWKTGVDDARLQSLFGWAKNIDTSFFNDKTRIILGDDVTAESVAFANGKLVPNATTRQGDGVVLDRCAKLPGVRTYKALGATHGWMAATFNVTRAVFDLLEGNDPGLVRSTLPLGQKPDPLIDGYIAEEHFDKRRPKRPIQKSTVSSSALRTSIQPGEATGGVKPPTHRRLRVFAMDPELMSDPETTDLGVMELEIPWEGPDPDHRRTSEFSPGPVGEYLEVVDVDPQSGKFYPPIDLNHPHVLAERGLQPTEENPQFHQQMVYAVAMSTIGVFERALGRAALWSKRLKSDDNEKGDFLSVTESYVPRLRIYPHAMRQRNAYYDPGLKALLFGYFPSASTAGSAVKPGATVFTCLSFDVVAHETSHALLDGLHRYFNYDSNRDVFAFHEAFADIVALLQRFANRDLMRHQMRLTRGDLRQKSLLTQMALQFGEASGGRGALRQYLNQFDKKTGLWKPVIPDAKALENENEPHQRGGLLVAAVFEALNSMYRKRAGDLFDVARRPDGEVTFTRELEARLADEASSAANHLLEMCIRALDYVPPIDITYGEYLRALITADLDLVKRDKYNYRACIVDAFRKWGIYPADKQTMIPDDLAWESPHSTAADGLLGWIKENPLGDWVPGIPRSEIFFRSQKLAASLHEWIKEQIPDMPENFDREFGLRLKPDAPRSIRRNKEGIPIFEVHSVRPCRRVGPDGQSLLDLVIEIVQKRKVLLDPKQQQALESGNLAYDDAQEDFYFRGGCTLIVDGRTGMIRYLMRKRIDHDGRLNQERQFHQGAAPMGVDQLKCHKKEGETNPFRLMHS